MRTVRTPPPMLPYTDVRRDWKDERAAPGAPGCSGATCAVEGGAPAPDQSGRGGAFPNGSRAPPSDGRAFSCAADRPASVRRFSIPPAIRASEGENSADFLNGPIVDRRNNASHDTPPAAKKPSNADAQCLTLCWLFIRARRSCAAARGP
jgi:hypothetical protein